MPIKSFRGQLADDGQNTIRLSTNNGLTGYKINKFQIMNKEAGASANELESTIKVYTYEQDTVDAVVDFDDPTLLAAAQLGTHASMGTYPQSTIIIFDNKKFNQDIFVTHKNLHGDASPCNYYVELEQFKLSVDEASVATLRDMRGSN